MVTKILSQNLRSLSYYYALLQLAHLSFLTRAGLIYLASGQIAFPAQPPPGGWAGEAIPFLLGMGAVDALAAGLALFAGWVLISRKEFLIQLWVVSLTIALTSAIVFCFGTIPSGAWGLNPAGYIVVSLLFAPLFVYYGCLIRFSVQPGAADH